MGRTLFGIALMTLALSGCGGGDDPKPANKPKASTNAVQPAEDGYTAAARVKHLWASRDCSRPTELLHPLFRADAKSCHQMIAIHREVTEGSTVSAKQYGTGLVLLINYRFKAALALDASRRFKLFTLYDGRGGAIHPDKSSDGVANTAIAALAYDDCQRLYQVSAIPGPNGMSARKLCARPALKPVRAALKEDPTARPKRLGGDGAFAFYSLEAAGKYFTVVLVGGRGYGFEDALPAN
jgi:hypothetical protein